MRSLRYHKSQVYDKWRPTQKIMFWLGIISCLLTLILGGTEYILDFYNSIISPKPFFEYRCIFTGGKSYNLPDNTSSFQYNGILFNLLNTGNKASYNVGFEIVFSPSSDISIKNIVIGSNPDCKIINPPPDINALSNTIKIKCDSLDPYPSSSLVVTTPILPIVSINYWSDDVEYTTLEPSCDIFSIGENATIKIKGNDIDPSYIKSLKFTDKFTQSAQTASPTHNLIGSFSLNSFSWAQFYP